MAAVPVLVFSDFTCPFCHVTEAALRRLEAEGLAAPRYAAFELYPADTALPAAPSADDWAAARPLAEELGVGMEMPPAVPRTRKAHEAAKLAAEKGVGWEMREAIFAAYFRDGRDVGRIDVLVELAAALGLDATETKVVLDVDSLSGAVAADEALARRLGIAAVPALIVGGGADAELLTGAQAYDDLRALLQRK
ncbi:DsbA family oxidoreductase [Longimicrobium sp.]|uniref:DsbA family oxidoreductase n=1 Tax=Longimicrobium sp. TaxID=2029185 RepID=UPI002D7EB2BA|nr:DsbA family protein [Longimicrobium sp.]